MAPFHPGATSAARSWIHIPHAYLVQLRHRSYAVCVHGASLPSAVLMWVRSRGPVGFSKWVMILVLNQAYISSRCLFPYVKTAAIGYGLDEGCSRSCSEVICCIKHAGREGEVQLQNAQNARVGQQARRQAGGHTWMASSPPCATNPSTTQRPCHACPTACCV